MNDKIDLTIIIVSWNVKNHLKQCLKSIFEARANLNLEIFVIDNNSKDDSTAMVRSNFPEVKLISNNQNLGFAKANNQAIKKARSEFILLLNPDTKLFPDTLANMVNWMKKNLQAKVAGCHLVDKQGRTIPHVRQFPTIWNQLAIILKLPHIFPSVLRRYLRKNFDYAKPQKVDSIRGGFFMMHAATEGDQTFGHLQVKLDEQYFLWFEEVDFCRQVQKNNQEVWYTPNAKCLDYVGQSFKQISSLKKQKIFKNSMLKYFKKWHPVWQYYILKTAWPIGLSITWVGEKLNIKFPPKADPLPVSGTKPLADKIQT